MLNNIPISAKVQGLFSMEVRSASGETVSKTEMFPNLVLDQGLELLGTTNPLEFCSVGSGVATPQKSDTTLEAHIATSTTRPEGKDVISGFNVSEGYNWVRKVFRFNQGTATGNISEVGVGGNNKLFNRTLVKDSQGLFATVTVMEDETLDVTVELRAYVDQNTRQYTVNMSGVDYTLRTEPVYIPFRGNSSHALHSSGVIQYGTTAYSDGISSRTGTPTRTVASFTGTGATTRQRDYVAGSKKQVFEFYWGLNAGNSAPTRTIVVPTSVGVYQTEFTPAIPKTSDHILRLTFEVSWDRYE